MNKKNTLILFTLILVVLNGFELFNTKKENRLVSGTDFCSKIHPPINTSSLSKELKGFEDKMKDQTGVYVLEDGAGAMITRAWLTENAEKTIDIQYFIFSTDNIGLIASDYLVRAANRGVKVRVLVDDLMVDSDIQDILTFDSHKNITVKIYNPGVNLGKSFIGKAKKFALDFRSANQRMHNKTFIVDNKVVITGGRNIADEYFDYDHEYNFRDRDVLLLGKETQSVDNSFNLFWNDKLSVNVSKVIDAKPNNITDKDRFNNLHEYACNPDNFWPQIKTKIEKLPDAFKAIKKSGKLVWLRNVEFLSDLPGKNNGKQGLWGGSKSTKRLIELVNNAKTSIEIQSPYLVTSQLSQNLFKAAVDRGVKIRILTNSLASTDNLEAFSGYQKDREKLLKTGVRIFEFKPDAQVRTQIMTGDLDDELFKKPIFGLHAKSMVIDNKKVVIGTFNLDPRSANLNTECIVIIDSKAIAKSVLSLMNIEFNSANSWETTLNFNPDSQVGNYKRVKTWTRKIVPKGIL